MSPPISKKLINSPATCVDDNLRGVVAVYPALRLHPRHRVVTLQPQEVSDRVAVLGGGGSGHEPFAAGLIGEGMLDGAVAGGVFAAPPTGHVLYAITQLHKYSRGGVLVIIGNYLGDRLNFGKAIEKAKAAGIKVEGLIVGEDVASSHNKTGGRSMCGEVFFYKLCGAMAMEGYDLDTMKQMAIEANQNMATLGVCLSACSLPGQPPLFEIAADEMELGAGVHGEAGIKKMKMGTAAEVVEMILDKIIEHMKLKSGDEVAVMMDNLGGTSFIEMNILSGETKACFEKRGITVCRMYSGHLKTSLEMHGFQVCTLRLPRERRADWLALLDRRTLAGAWPGTELSVPDLRPADGDDDSADVDKEEVKGGPLLTSSQQKLLHECLLAAASTLVSSEGLLNKLDSGCGDGDCGTTLKNFATAVQSHEWQSSLQSPAGALSRLSEMAETDMGGSSGGIYSLGLAAASQALLSSKDSTITTWVRAWESAMQAISKYGGAEPGDRTMLDTMAAALEEMKLHRELKSFAQNTCAAADKGAKNTAKMEARAGRASYVSREYLGAEDAGARAVAIWLGAILNRLQQV